MQTKVNPSTAPAPNPPAVSVTVWRRGDAPIASQPHRFSADEYEQMTAVGVLTEDDRVELIEGNIIEMSPIGSRHAACVNRVVMRLAQLVGDAAIVSAQNAIRLGDDSEPQPDVALLKRRMDFYAEALPMPPDIWLVVEVSDTTLEFDRDVKLPLYARHGILAAWLINLADDSVLDCTDPVGGSYQTQRRATRGERLVVPSLSDAAVSVDEVLGPVRAE
jgi:Uma2 family endonuclease